MLIDPKSKNPDDKHVSYVEQKTGIERAVNSSQFDDSRLVVQAYENLYSPLQMVGLTMRCVCLIITGGSSLRRGGAEISFAWSFLLAQCATVPCCPLVN